MKDDCRTALRIQKKPGFGLSPGPRAWQAFAVVTLLLAASVHGETTRTQTIALQKGWNAVFLQVSPTNRDPEAVFGNIPVEIVATYFAVEKPVQYIQNPANIGWNKEGWSVWYARNRSDAFLSNLHAVHGNRAFLIFAKQDFTWSLTGVVGFASVRWKNDSFNLVGFGLDETAPPTFDQFFAGSAAHHPYRIYRLINSQWTLVADPIRTTMRSGEACWIYCNGASDYQGPLRTSLLAGDTLDFGTASDTWIKFGNESSYPLNVRIEKVASDGGLPLSYTIRGITPGAMLPVSVTLPASYQLPQLEAGQITSFWLALRRESMIRPIQSTLLKITTDNGMQLWVPVTGARTDLTAAQ